LAASAFRRRLSCPEQQIGSDKLQQRKVQDTMLDHVSLGVSDLERSRRFYDAILRPLGVVRTADFGRSPIGGAGSDYGMMLGQIGGVELTITAETAVAPARGAHLCLRAFSREAVWAFHAAALDSGGRSDGAPGPRPQYHPDYYAAFVLDPDGHRIEAACHLPGSAP
jgi:catechol 2,3-dioxygenase-like lactoylglutathione lyase family enzyme